MTKEPEKKHLYIEGMVKPLAWVEIDHRRIGIPDRPPSAENALRFICGTTQPVDPEDLAKIYERISDAELTTPMHIAPNEPRIIGRLIRPLRDAKACFVIGNHLGVIALCGMVAEMVAILLFEMGDVQLNNIPMDEGAQRRPFGQVFEKLGQERRTKVLRAYSLITEEQESRFDRIREIRRQHLHFFTGEGPSADDAEQCYSHALALVSTIIGQQFDSGAIAFTPGMIKLLQRLGIAKEVDASVFENAERMTFEPKPDERASASGTGDTVFGLTLRYSATSMMVRSWSTPEVAVSRIPR